jgi:hypothetical protein
MILTNSFYTKKIAKRRSMAIKFKINKYFRELLEAQSETTEDFQ